MWVLGSYRIKKMKKCFRTILPVMTSHSYESRLQSVWKLLSVFWHFTTFLTFLGPVIFLWKMYQYFKYVSQVTVNILWRTPIVALMACQIMWVLYSYRTKKTKKCFRTILPVMTSHSYESRLQSVWKRLSVFWHFTTQEAIQKNSVALWTTSMVLKAEGKIERNYFSSEIYQECCCCWLHFLR